MGLGIAYRPSSPRDLGHTQTVRYDAPRGLHELAAGPLDISRGIRRGRDGVRKTNLRPDPVAPRPAVIARLVRVRRARCEEEPDGAQLRELAMLDEPRAKRLRVARGCLWYDFSVCTPEVQVSQCARAQQ